MEFNWSGETDKDVGREFAVLMRSLEKAIGLWLNPRSYGAGVREWAFVGIIIKQIPGFEDFFQEIKKYHKKSKVVEFRLRIDHQRFLGAVRSEREKQVVHALLRSLELIGDLPVPDFDHQRLITDFREFALDRGWIGV